MASSHRVWGLPNGRLHPAAWGSNWRMALVGWSGGRRRIWANQPVRCSGSAHAIPKRFVGDPLGPPDVFNGSESPAVKTIYSNSHNLIHGPLLRAVEQDGQDWGVVNPVLRLATDAALLPEWFAERLESGCCQGSSTVHLWTPNHLLENAEKRSDNMLLLCGSYPSCICTKLTCISRISEWLDWSCG